MYVVAIAELATAADVEATALAADLGVTAYDARLVLNGGLPAVVRRVPDRPRALELVNRLRARGHDVVTCEESAVVPSSAMVAMRRPRLGDAGISLDDRPDESLPFDDVLAFIAARHRSRTETSTESVDRKFSATRALVSGGVVMTKSVTTETRSASEQREHVLYVFRKGGGTPWILHEHRTHWSGLVVPLARSESENFKLGSAALRARAPAAAYDDRLVARRTAQERIAVVASGGSSRSSSVSASSERTIDLLAHLIALSIARPAYR